MCAGVVSMPSVKKATNPNNRPLNPWGDHGPRSNLWVGAGIGQPILSIQKSR